MLKIREALSDEIELIRNQRGKAHEDHAKVAQLLSPFLPFSSEKVKEMLHLGLSLAINRKSMLSNYSG